MKRAAFLPLFLPLVLGCTGPTWLRGNGAPASGAPGSSVSGGPGPTTGRFMTRAEYINSLTDLLRFDASPFEDDLPEDVASKTTGFLASSDGLLPSGARTSSYERVAERVALSVNWKGNLDRFAKCTDSAVACQEGFVDRLATLFFRKPPTKVEREGLVSLFRVEDTKGPAAFQTGARLVLQAVLQSQHFLFILESDDNFDPVTKRPVVSPYDMVTRLSFLLWKSAPDERLLATVSADGLRNVAAVSELAQRMLADPRATRGLRGYANEWLKLYQSARRSVNSSRGITASFLRDSTEETLRFVSRIALSGDLMALFTDKRSELTAELAAIYGLSPIPSKKRGPAFAMYDLSGATMRQGLLTQPAFLGVRADIDHASVVDRGLVILRNLVCRDAALPPSVNNQFGTDVPKDASDREKLSIHATAPGCRACHQAFDPFGYAFEKFDVAGRLLEKDDHGNILRSDGEALLDGKPVPFKDAIELSNLMAKSPEVEACMTQKMFMYAFNRPIETAADEASAGRLAAAFSKGGRTYGAMIHALVSSAEFNSVSPRD